MAKYEGRGSCACCSKPVEVYTDKNNMAYYKCGPCGAKVMHSIPRQSAAFLRTIDREADEDAIPENPGNSGPAVVVNPTLKTEPAPKKPGFKFPSLV